MEHYEHGHYDFDNIIEQPLAFCIILRAEDYSEDRVEYPESHCQSPEYDIYHLVTFF